MAVVKGSHSDTLRNYIVLETEAGDYQHDFGGVLPWWEPKVVSEGGTGHGKGHERKMRKGAKAFGMLAKETAVSLSRCVRQSGYISRVNDSDISISVSVRWLSLPTLPGRASSPRSSSLFSSREPAESSTLGTPPSSSLSGFCARGRDGPGRFRDRQSRFGETRWRRHAKTHGLYQVRWRGERKARRTDSECTRCKGKRHGPSYRNFNWELARRYDTYLRIRGGRRLPFSSRFSLAVRGDKGIEDAHYDR